RHADPTGTVPLTATALPEGLSMITSGDLDDVASPRVAAYLPRFRAAAAPNPETGDWSAWEALLASDDSVGRPANAAMNFAMPNGFATVSSALLALPAIGRTGVRPAFRFAARRPTPGEWQDIPV